MAFNGFFTLIINANILSDQSELIGTIMLNSIYYISWTPFFTYLIIFDFLPGVWSIELQFIFQIANSRLELEN